MKKIWLLTVFFLGLFLYWCWNQATTTQSEIFKNDLKCQDLLEDYREEMKIKWNNDIFVFYSPIENSCLWTFQTYNLYNNDMRYDSYSYTIEKLSDLHKYAYFEISNYYSWDDLIGIKHVTNKFTNEECNDIDYRYYETEEGKEFYENTNRCKFDNIKERFEEELEYLKWN